MDGNNSFVEVGIILYCVMNYNWPQKAQVRWAVFKWLYLWRALASHANLEIELNCLLRNYSATHALYSCFRKTRCGLVCRIVFVLTGHSSCVFHQIAIFFLAAGLRFFYFASHLYSLSNAFLLIVTAISIDILNCRKI